MQSIPPISSRSLSTSNNDPITTLYNLINKTITGYDTPGNLDPNTIIANIMQGKNANSSKYWNDNLSTIASDIHSILQNSNLLCPYNRNLLENKLGITASSSIKDIQSALNNSDHLCSCVLVMSIMYSQMMVNNKLVSSTDAAIYSDYETMNTVFSLCDTLQQGKLNLENINYWTYDLLNYVGPFINDLHGWTADVYSSCDDIKSNINEYKNGKIDFNTLYASATNHLNYINDLICNQ